MQVYSVLFTGHSTPYYVVAPSPEAAIDGVTSVEALPDHCSLSDVSPGVWRAYRTDDDVYARIETVEETGEIEVDIVVMGKEGTFICIDLRLEDRA